MCAQSAAVRSRSFDRLILFRGFPGSRRLSARARGQRGRETEPGKPNQNAYIERFNRTYRTEVLNAYAFEGLDQVQQITDPWLTEYNEERPHDALGRVPPLTYLPRATTTGRSSFKVST